MAATRRGPLRFIHKPPAKAAKPSMRIANPKARVGCDTDQPKFLVRGIRKTLQAYTAPSATCITMPATAITHRFELLLVILLILVNEDRSPMAAATSVAASADRASAATAR